MKIEDIFDVENLVEKLDTESLDNIAFDVKQGYEIDKMSIQGWLDRTEEYIRLATQVSEEKTFPWPNASNVKYPLLTTAALQFSARSYPALVSGTSPVNIQTIGYDHTGDKIQQAIRLSRHMSYQLLHKMTEWEEHMDRLLMTLPIVGTAFKKTYFCPSLGRNVSEMVNPTDFVVNYYAKSLEGANRKFHRFVYYENEIIEKMRSGFYATVDLDTESRTNRASRLDEETQELVQPELGDDAPFDVLECHIWYDLDNDGYKEPYILTMLEHTGTILRMVPRFTPDNVEFNADNEVKKITADEYFTNFIFIPDPASSIFGLGFGHLLGPLNDTANTLINQLIDAGTLQTTGGGFLGRGFKLRNMGQIRFKPGEWKTTQSTGDDLRKNIFPLPVPNPSPVLFQLLGMIVDSGQKLSSTMDMMMGESPGQNQPATTTMAVLEQGLKVFTSIHKRVYRSFKEELGKLFRLNARYLQPIEYFRVLDYGKGRSEQQGVPPQGPASMPGMPPMPGMPQVPPQMQTMQPGGSHVTLEDYKQALDSVDVAPAADPKVVSQAQSLMKAEALLALMGSGAPLNAQEVIRRVLEAQEQPNIDALLNTPPPQPNPEEVRAEKELEHRIQFDNRKLELEAKRVLSEAVKDESQGIKSRVDAEVSLRDMSNTELETESKIVRERISMMTEPDKEDTQMRMKQNAAIGMAGTRTDEGTY
jgi:chaperonin GroES